MTDIKSLLGVLAVLVGFVSYIPYFKGIIQGKTKPHAFSWLVFSILLTVVFIAQVSEQGAAGAWVTGFTMVIQIIVFLFAIIKGDRLFSSFDWVCLAMAMICLVSWRLTHSVVVAVILAVSTDFVGFLPTLRKGYRKPWEDVPSLWLLTGLKWVVSLFALGAYSFVTLLYPVYIISLSLLYTGMLLWRRRS